MARATGIVGAPRFCGQPSVCEALRMANDDAISHAPITTSQMPTTNASIQMDSNGDAITTMPAMEVDHADEDGPSRPGSTGSLIAETGGDAAKMNRCRSRWPTEPCHRNGERPKTARMSEAPLMNNRIRPPETCRLNAKT